MCSSLYSNRLNCSVSLLLLEIQARAYKLGCYFRVFFQEWTYFQESLCMCQQERIYFSVLPYQGLNLSIYIESSHPPQDGILYDRYRPLISEAVSALCNCFVFFFNHYQPLSTKKSYRYNLIIFHCDVELFLLMLELFHNCFFLNQVLL